MSNNDEERSDSFIRALLAGACAGVAVDVSLYPLDTIKTRLLDYAASKYTYIFSAFS